MDVLYAQGAGEEKQILREGQTGEGKVTVFVSASWNLAALCFPLVAKALLCRLSVWETAVTHESPFLALNLLHSHYSIQKLFTSEDTEVVRQFWKLVSSFVSHAPPITANIVTIPHSKLQPWYSCVYGATVLLWCWANQGSQGGILVGVICCKEHNIKLK